MRRADRRRSCCSPRSLRPTTRSRSCRRGSSSRAGELHARIAAAARPGSRRALPGRSARCRPSTTNRPSSAPTEMIAAGRFRKIVLAREVQVHAPAAYDPAAIFGVLREQFPSCFNFCVGRGASDASSPRAPSCSCAARASASARSRSPASTRRSADPSVDDHLGEQMLRDPSLREEHEIVAQRIERTLEPHAVWVAAAPEPEIVRIANIQHLATPIRAQLARPMDALELAGTDAPDAGGRRRAARGRRADDPGARGPRPRLVPRAGRLDATRSATASSASRCAARCSKAASRAATPAAGSCATRSRPSSSPRPRSSSRRCCRCSPARARRRRRDHIAPCSATFSARSVRTWISVARGGPATPALRPPGSSRGGDRDVVEAEELRQLSARSRPGSVVTWRS